MSTLEASPSKKRRIEENVTLPFRISLEEPQTVPDNSVQWSTSPIASYSWDRSSTLAQPRIVIPGQARVYKPANHPFRVDRDTQQGSSKMEWDLENAMESSFHAVAVCSPHFDWSTIDIVTDRNNLRKLLRLVDPVQKRPIIPGVEETFKILVDIPKGDRPIVFTAYRTGLERTSLGVGVAFEEYVTKAPTGTENFEEYHRLLLLTIGDLKILVRTEADAVASSPQYGPLPPDWKLCEKSQKMHYKAYGKFNANETVVEMKSKSAFFPDFPWRSTFDQMLFGKVDKLVLGWHKKGFFEPPKEYKFSEVRMKVDDDVDKRIRQLGELLRRLLEAVRQEDIPKALELSWDGGQADLIVQGRKVGNNGITETCRFVESFME